MLLIDHLLEREGDRAAASAFLTKDSLCFSERGGILPEYFIEIIAQTMAAANGYDAISCNNPPKEGFIVGIDIFSIYHIPEGASEFRIQVVKNMEFGSMKVMEGEVFSGPTRVAAIELKVWEQAKGEK
jgi:predicted hotdog family 3-hydroxylacyl-ACP dehydratase